MEKTGGEGKGKREEGKGRGKGKGVEGMGKLSRGEGGEWKKYNKVGKEF
jgi:hypothetical protein